VTYWLPQVRDKFLLTPPLKFRPLSLRAIDKLVSSRYKTRLFPSWGFGDLARKIACSVGDGYASWLARDMSVRLIAFAVLPSSSNGARSACLHHDQPPARQHVNRCLFRLECDWSV
jgi:hypothetical protein